MHYFSPDRPLITGLSLPLSPVYFPIKMIVTASGNSNHLNHSSFVEDRGMWWVYHWGNEVTGGGGASCVSKTEVFGPIGPLAPDPQWKGNGISGSGQGEIPDLKKGHLQTQVLNCFCLNTVSGTCVSKGTGQTTCKTQHSALNSSFI